MKMFIDSETLSLLFRANVYSSMHVLPNQLARDMTNEAKNDCNMPFVIDFQRRVCLQRSGKAVLAICFRARNLISLQKEHLVVRSYGHQLAK